MKKAVRMRRAALASLLLLCSCATFPRQELSGYVESFEAAQTAAAPMIADYGTAERAARLAQLRADAARGFPQRGYFPTFRADDATAAATAGLPPGAEAIDRSLRAIAAYNATLVALAEGRNIDEVRGQLRVITGTLSAIVPVPQVAALAPAMEAVATALRPAIEADNRREFTRLVLDGHAPVSRLIMLLRDFTPTQYSLTTAALRSAEIEAAPELRVRLVASLNDWHRAFANYVALLEAMQASLDRLREAVANPRRPGGVLARASADAAALQAYADALRGSLDALRAVR